MFKKIAATATIITMSLALSGCTVFYPHWGRDGHANSNQNGLTVFERKH